MLILHLQAVIKTVGCGNRLDPLVMGFAPAQQSDQPSVHAFANCSYVTDECDDQEEDRLTYLEGSTLTPLCESLNATMRDGGITKKQARLEDYSPKATGSAINQALGKMIFVG